jgi:hypothetical protein
MDDDAHETADIKTHSVPFTVNTLHGVNEMNTYESSYKA